MDVGPYRINLDALLARLVYRWHGRSIGVLLLLTVLAGLLTGVIPPLWQGRAQLAIAAAPGATITIDGRAWPRTVYAGAHTVVASLPDGRAAWADIDIHAGQALTVTLPTGLPAPRIRPLPAPAPGMRIDHVWWADGAWRVTSVPMTPDASDVRRQPAEPTPTAMPGQTVALDAHGVERLSTLDAYAGLADQVHVARGQGDTSSLREAVYHPDPSRGLGDSSFGSIEVRGWGQAVSTVPISAPLTLLRFSPDGAALLEAEALPGGGEQVYRIGPDGRRAPVVAVPGRITRLSWRPDSRAIVLHSLQGDRLTLTLVRLTSSIVAATIADLPVAAYAASLVPLTWDDTGLLWVAPDDSGGTTLWRAPLTTLIPDRVGLLAARALTRLPDGALRAVTIQGDTVVIGRYQGDIFIGEAKVAGVPATADLAGMWQGNELLLQGGGRAWLLDLVDGRP